MSNSRDPMHCLYPASLLCPWDFPGKNTGVRNHSLLQGIFPTQGSKPGSHALQPDSLPSEPPGKLLVTLGRTSSLPLSASGGCQHSLACGHITPIFACLIPLLSLPPSVCQKSHFFFPLLLGYL